MTKLNMQEVDNLTKRFESQVKTSTDWRWHMGRKERRKLFWMLIFNPMRYIYFMYLTTDLNTQCQFAFRRSTQADKKFIRTTLYTSNYLEQ